MWMDGAKPRLFSSGRYPRRGRGGVSIPDMLEGVQRNVAVAALPGGTASHSSPYTRNQKSLECTGPRPVLHLDLRSVGLNLPETYAGLCGNLGRALADENSKCYVDFGAEVATAAVPSGRESPFALAGHRFEPGSLGVVVFLLSILRGLLGQLSKLHGSLGQPV